MADTKKYKDPTYLQEEKAELEKLYSELNGFEAEILDHFHRIKESRVVGGLNFLQNQTKNIVEIKKTKLDVIEKKININKIIGDFDLKDKSDEEENGNNEALFKDFIAYMNSSKVNNSNNNQEYDNYDSDDNIQDLLDNRIEKLENSGDLKFSKEDSAVRYEKENVTIKVRYNRDTEEWKFGAYGENGKRIKDYPLPLEDEYEMSFSKNHKDELIATDNYGNEYSVVFMKKKTPNPQ